MKVFLVKQGNNSFLPSHDSDYETLKKIKVGVTVSCEIKQPRNIGFHRKFFALINLASFKMQPGRLIVPASSSSSVIPERSRFAPSRLRPVTFLNTTPINSFSANEISDISRF